MAMSDEDKTKMEMIVREIEEANRELSNYLHLLPREVPSTQDERLMRGVPRRQAGYRYDDEEQYDKLLKENTRLRKEVDTFYEKIATLIVKKSVSLSEGQPVADRLKLIKENLKKAEEQLNREHLQFKLTAFGTAADKKLEQVANKVRSSAQDIRTGVKEAGTAISSKVDALGEKAKEVKNAVTSKAKAVGDRITEAAEKVKVAGVVTALKHGWGHVAVKSHQCCEAISDFFEGLAKGIVRGVKTVAKGIVTAGKGVAGGVLAVGGVMVAGGRALLYFKEDMGNLWDAWQARKKTRERIMKDFFPHAERMGQVDYDAVRTKFKEKFFKEPSSHAPEGPAPEGPPEIPAPEGPGKK